MKSSVLVNIGLLTLIATGFYTYVGQLVPQKEVYPPEVTELAADMTTEDLVEVGREVVEGKGLCLTCHTIGQSGALRFPDLAGIGGRAGQRVPGLSDLEYLAQSLYEPEAYIVPGFTGGMPQVNRPPVGLTDDEIRAVLAYLQSLGGTPTIDMATVIPYAEGGAAPVPGGEAAAVEATATAAAEEARQQLPGGARAQAQGPAALVEAFQCAGCHQPGGEGAPLAELAARLTREQLLAAVAAHEQLPGGEQLRAAGYGERVTLGEARALADFLAAGGGR
ncbi:MAG TPA: c-type cytochrome [Thermoanaerobaculia bacterium]|nr:c-type cytochrome [Thermoanaerobaculia bacterium]